jgi:hypothetical protein
MLTVYQTVLKKMIPINTTNTKQKKIPIKSVITNKKKIPPPILTTPIKTPQNSIKFKKNMNNNLQSISHTNESLKKNNQDIHIVKKIIKIININTKSILKSINIKINKNISIRIKKNNRKSIPKNVKIIIISYPLNNAIYPIIVPLISWKKIPVTDLLT